MPVSLDPPQWFPIHPSLTEGKCHPYYWVEWWCMKGRCTPEHLKASTAYDWWLQVCTTQGACLLEHFWGLNKAFQNAKLRVFTRKVCGNVRNKPIDRMPRLFDIWWVEDYWNKSCENLHCTNLQGWQSFSHSVLKYKYSYSFKKSTSFLYFVWLII